MPLAPAFKRVSAKRAVAVVNDSPVGCQSRDRIRLSELSQNLFCDWGSSVGTGSPSQESKILDTPLTSAGGKGALCAPQAL